VYQFCLFRRRENPHSFVPDPTQFPSSGCRPLPYIFSESDILAMLAATDALLPHAASPLHREVARAAIVILYTTGLRRGEVVRLTFNDYDRTAQVLHVLRTKFGKSRLVPLSADTTAELDRYLEAHRRAGAPREQDSPLLVNHHGERFRGYTGAGLGQLLRKITRAGGVKTARNRTPRVHDLRFTFAAQALLRWYRDGVDVQSRLPALATYMGHVSVVSTQYYLTFLTATAEAASERFYRHAAAWLGVDRTDRGRP
jgi:integrase